MKKAIAIKIEIPPEADALRILRQIPGVEAIPRDSNPQAGFQPDAVIRFQGSRAHIAVEFKRQANAATAWQLAHYAETLGGVPLLLIADQTTVEARRILQDHGVAVVDGLGNAHLELPGLLLHLEGGPRPRRSAGPAPPTRLRAKAGVVAQALLLDPQRQWHLGELAGQAQVSTGLVHRVVSRLESEGLVGADGRGPRRTRRVVDPTALLDLLAEEDVQRPARLHAYTLAQSPAQLLEKIGNGLEEAGIDYALTGAAGASLTAPFTTAVPVAEVWVAATADPGDLCPSIEAAQVSQGHNVVFLQEAGDTRLTFRQQTDRVWVANRFRLYVDLLRDPKRGREQAEYLRREVIGF